MGAPSSSGAVSLLPSPSPCEDGYGSLRDDVERKGKLVREASGRHARPDEACKLVGAYAQAEVKMIKYLETNAQQCGIAPQIVERLKSGHKNTEGLERKVCAIAQETQQRGPGAPLRRCGPGEYFHDDCVFEMDLR